MQSMAHGEIKDLPITASVPIIRLPSVSRNEKKDRNMNHASFEGYSSLKKTPTIPEDLRS